jgi:glycosyltransferase involved in cell wall biosynthesis
MNVLFISHCDFTGNSALHVLAVANELERRGIAPAIAVPSKPSTVDDVGRPGFHVLDFETAKRGAVRFPDGRGPDVVHAFTPREHVRRLGEAITARYRCPYIVHLEDNEEVVLADEVGAQVFAELDELPLELSDAIVPLHRTHPRRGRAFLERAGGVTALLDTLLEFKPEWVPGTVFWPGVDEGMLNGVRGREAVRAELGLRDDEFVLVYTGNIHDSNLAEVRSLYLAVRALRRAGHGVTLVKTGLDHVDMSWVRDWGLDDGLRELGFVARERVWELMYVADALVQPGGPSAFNNYRFPSKLPDFLASGTPVVLPATNIGRHLRDGVDALLLQRGDALEIFEALERLIGDAALRRRLGSNGREFALRELRWSKSAEPIAELYASVHDRVRAGRTAPVDQARTAPPPPAKTIAFYLPQFHTIPENDEWWGEGFTEWTNVRRGRPQYEDHHQPHVPNELGYYDLRDAEVMTAQARLARAHGIYGFCFYYYWFDGRRILEHPIDTLLERDEPAFPFCYCWANENWTRRWDGLEEDILLEQSYTPGWDERFIRDVLPGLADRRYIRVGDDPLLLVYRADLIPDTARALEAWREVAQRELGVDLHLAAVQSFGIGDPRPYGFDAAVEFPPHNARFLLDHDQLPDVDPSFAGYFEDYRAVMLHQLGLDLPDYRWYRGAMPSWDNTARRGSLAHILVGSSPELYEQWLRKLLLQSMSRASVDEPLVFVNAWNEWAEGTHLEPDEKHGHAWLDATHTALRDALRQYHAARGRILSEAGASEHLRLTLPPL